MGGVGSIYYRAVSQYAADHGIAGDAFRLFHTLLSALDAEYTAFEAERQEAERQKREQDREKP